MNDRLRELDTLLRAGGHALRRRRLERRSRERGDLRRVEDLLDAITRYRLVELRETHGFFGSVIAAQRHGPAGSGDMLDLIKRIHRVLGISLIVSSHILEDIERVCDYVVTLSEGRLMLAQPIEGVGTEQGDLLLRIDGAADAFIRRLAGVGVHADRGAGGPSGLPPLFACDVQP